MRKEGAFAFGMNTLDSGFSECIFSAGNVDMAYFGPRYEVCHFLQPESKARR